MRNLLLLLLVFIQCTHAQIPVKLNTKFAFYGDFLLYFTEKNNNLSVDMMLGGTYRFTDLYQQGRLTDSSFLQPVQVIDTVSAYRFLYILHYGPADNPTRYSDTMWLSIDKSNPDRLNISEKNVFYPKGSGIIPNGNCDTAKRSCSVILYDHEQLKRIQSLKKIDLITEGDMTKFLDQLEALLKKRCNLCVQNYLESDINDIVIKLGYNPVGTLKAAQTTNYKISALRELNFLLTAKFRTLNTRYNSLIGNFYSPK